MLSVCLSGRGGRREALHESGPGGPSELRERAAPSLGGNEGADGELRAWENLTLGVS